MQQDFKTRLTQGLNSFEIPLHQIADPAIKPDCLPGVNLLCNNRIELISLILFNNK